MYSNQKVGRPVGRSGRECNFVQYISNECYVFSGGAGAKKPASGAEYEGHARSVRGEPVVSREIWVLYNPNRTSKTTFLVANSTNFCPQIWAKSTKIEPTNRPCRIANRGRKGTKNGFPKTGQNRPFWIVKCWSGIRPIFGPKSEPKSKIDQNRTSKTTFLVANSTHFWPQIWAEVQNRPKSGLENDLFGREFDSFLAPNLNRSPKSPKSDPQIDLFGREIGIEKGSKRGPKKTGQNRPLSRRSRVAGRPVGRSRV